MSKSQFKSISSRIFSSLAVISLAILATSELNAATFQPKDSEELRKALSKASLSVEDDTIELGAMTYSTATGLGSGFFYYSELNSSLTIVGQGKGVSVLDGAGSTLVLGITVNPEEDVAINRQVILRNLSLRNGYSNNLFDNQLFRVFGKSLSIELDNVEFKGNQNPLFSAALLSTKAGAITVTGSTFESNESGGSASVVSFLSEQGPINVSNSLFVSNAAESEEGESAPFQLKTSSGMITLDKNVFRGNRADSPDALGGALNVLTQSGIVRVTGNTFESNHAGGSAGALRLSSQSSEVRVDSNTFSSNSSGGDGGAIIASSEGGRVLFRNNLLFGNSAPSGAAGAALTSNRNGEVYLIHNTFFGNSAQKQGGALWIDGVETTTHVHNNIFFGNTGGSAGKDVYYNAVVLSALRLFNNDIGEICLKANDSCDPSTLPNQADNRNENPKFLGEAAKDFSLAANSPLVNSGDSRAPHLPDVDRKGNPRTFGIAPDLGAFEFGAESTLDPAAPGNGDQGGGTGNGAGGGNDGGSQVVPEPASASSGGCALGGGNESSFYPLGIAMALFGLAFVGRRKD